MDPAIAKRILVDASLQQQLATLLVLEERVLDPDNMRYSRPKELSQSLSEDIVDGNFSEIFVSRPMPEYGTAQNRRPQLSAGHPSKAPSGPTAQQTRIMSSEYMKASQQSKLHAWSAGIEQDANPEVPASAPIEAIQEEDDGDITTAIDNVVIDGEDGSAQLTKRQVAVDSDEEGEETRASEAQSPLPAPPAVDPTSKNHSYLERRPATRPERLSRVLVAGEADLLEPDSTVSESTLPRVLVPHNPRQESSASRPVDHDHRHRQKTSGRRRIVERCGGLYEEDDNEDVSQLPSSASEKTQYNASESRAQAGHEDYITVPLRSANNTVATATSSRADMKYNQQPDSVEDASSDGGWQEVPSRKQKSRGQRPTQQSTSHFISARTEPISAWPSPPPRGSHTQSQDQNRLLARPPQTLIQVQEFSRQNGRTQPPPGLNLRSPSREYTTTSYTLLDSPLEDIQRPSLRPQHEVTPSASEEHSSSTKASSGSHGTLFEYTPQTQISKPDVNFMRNTILAQLDNRIRERPLRNSEKTERIHEEEDTPRFYNTMNLQAGSKPKKPRSSVKSRSTHETAAEAAARIQKVKDDIFGVSPSTKFAEESPVRPVAKEDRLTKGALKIARTNPAMAAIHADNLQAEALRMQAQQIYKMLGVPLEAAQSFAGELTLELQLGRVLIAPCAAQKPGQIYTKHKWHDLFATTLEQPAVYFTNQLTSSGLETDHLVRTRVEGQLWEHETADNVRNLLEFHCQAENHDFVLVLDLDQRSHCLQRAASIISRIGIQCTAKIWDVCAVLEGHSIWHDAPDEVSNITDVFLDTLYVKPGHSCQVYYRPPPHNNLLIHSVVSKRAVVYNSKRRTGVQLKVEEIKTLYTAVHMDDKRLHRSYERQWDQMADDAQIYYQVSIVHKDLIQAFEANQHLQLGQSTSAASALTLDMVQAMLVTAVGQVSKMNFVGSATRGTLIRITAADQQRQDDLISRLPPSMGARYQGHSSRIVPVAQSGIETTRGGATTATTQLPPGIWAKSVAQLRHDRITGERYMIGINGARIPVTGDESRSSSREVLPDDSASQIGTARRQVRGSVFADDKGEGFW